MQRVIWITTICLLLLAGCSGVDWFPENSTNIITVTAAPTSPVVGAPVTITATVKKSDGSAVADGTSVSFSATLTTTGTAGGVPTITPSATTTGGIATATLTVPTAGTAVVTASSGTGSGQVSVIFVSTITVTTTPGTISTSVTNTVAITATVKDTSGNIVADNTTVDFAAAVGTFSTPTKTSNGVATVNLTIPSGAATSGSIIIITATATVNGTSSSGTASVQVFQ